MLFKKWSKLIARVEALEAEVEKQRIVEEHLRQAILYLADAYNWQPADWYADRLKYIQPTYARGKRC